MTELSTFERFERNLASVVRRAVETMPDDERERRVAACHLAGEYGCRMLLDPDAGTFEVRWGGATLVAGLVASLESDEVPDGYRNHRRGSGRAR